MEDLSKKILEKKPLGAVERYKLEKELADRYGAEGVKVYLLIDGKSSAEEIMKKVGMREDKFLDIINYLGQKEAFKGEMQKPPELAVKEAPVPKEIPPIPLVKTEEVKEKSSALEMMMVKEAEKPPAPELPKQPEPPKILEPQKTEVKPPELPEKKPEVQLPQRIPQTPLEKKLYERFGEAGLNVYSLIDELKTPRDILNQTKMSEEELVKILEFMNSEGIIKLEKPKEAMEKPIMKSPPQPPVEKKVPIEPPKPVEKPAELPKPPEKPKPVELPKPAQITFDTNEIYIPTLTGMNLLTKLKTETDILRKYGNEGVKAFSSMNGKRTNVRIVKETKIHPAHLDSLISSLAERGLVKLKQLTPNEIKELYGEEGLVIYNKYKRDGILLYELIDKKATLKDIVKTSGIEPKLAVEIFAFIHKALGLEIPLDKELLYRQLGIKP
ncbi:MAG: hypothetical protein QXF56_00425 [Candidatus Micrarchaeia archaeon]